MKGIFYTRVSDSVVKPNSHIKVSNLEDIPLQPGNAGSVEHDSEERNAPKSGRFCATEMVVSQSRL